MEKWNLPLQTPKEIRNRLELLSPVFSRNDFFIYTRKRTLTCKIVTVPNGCRAAKTKDGPTVLL